MHPVTNPSMQGLGHTPSFLVEGSWVIGFFMDAKEKQQPMIIGSELPGIPQELTRLHKKDLMILEVLLVHNQNMLELQLTPYPVDGLDYDNSIWTWFR